MLQHAQGELLAQVRPDGTTAVLAFTASLRTEITLIRAVIDPDSGPSMLNIAIYQDDAGGSTFDQTTIIDAEQRSQSSQESVVFQAQHPGSGIHVKPGGQIGVKTDNADDVTFSIYGVTENIAPQG